MRQWIVSLTDDDLVETLCSVYLHHQTIGLTTSNQHNLGEAVKDKAKFKAEFELSGGGGASGE